MSELKVVTEDELRPVLDKLAHLRWPIPFDDAASVLTELGWTLKPPSVGHTRFNISLPTVDLGQLDGELSRIDFPVTDMVHQNDSAGMRAVQEAFPRVMQIVSSCLGCEPTGPIWGAAGVKWDLANGGQICVPEGVNSVDVEVYAKCWVDLERDEIRLGIDPNNEDELIW